MNVRRILAMGVDELASRGRQEASKIVDRIRPAGWPAEAGPDGKGGLHPARGERVRSMGRDHGGDPRNGFFEGAASEGTVGVLRERFAEDCRLTMAAAESLCEGRFDLLGHRDLSFGDPVDWQLDPFSGRRAPRVHWSRINSLDHASVGNVKIVWELNRHQWLLPLAQAYRLTGAERFADVAARYLEGWMQANPPGQGINWASSLEAALRLMSWCWADALLRDARAWSPRFMAKVRAGIAAHASHVARFLSHHFSPNTHLTGEAIGLLYAGAFLPGEPAAGRWRRLGARILVQQCRRQILPDGVYFERSTGYQRYTAETYLHFLILASRNSLHVPAEVRERVERSLDFLLAIRTPDGSMPEIGDADGGSLLPLAVRGPADLRGVFSTAAALLGRTDFAWAAGSASPEALWLLGPAGVAKFDALAPAPPPSSPSRMHADGGYAVMRSSWAQGAHQLIVDTGPLGCPLSAGHGHADLLSLQCAAFGTGYVVDPGTYTYTAEPEWRDHFRSTAAHSTVVVDGRGQAVPSGPFSWATRPAARLRRWQSGRDLDYLDAEHEAFGAPTAPIVHRRRVLFVKPDYFILVDDIDGAGKHRVDLRFQFSPVPIGFDVDHWIRARGPSGHGLLLRVFSLADLKAEIREGSMRPRAGWISRRFGARTPAPHVSFAASTQLPARIVTILMPLAEGNGPAPAAYPVIVEGPRLAGVVVGDGRDFIGIEEQGLSLRRG